MKPLLLTPSWTNALGSLAIWSNSGRIPAVVRIMAIQEFPHKATIATLFLETREAGSKDSRALHQFSKENCHLS